VWGPSALKRPYRVTFNNRIALRNYIYIYTSLEKRSSRIITGKIGKTVRSAEVFVRGILRRTTTYGRNYSNAIVARSGRFFMAVR